MMGGLSYMTGPPGRPLRAGTSVNDIMGGMFGAIGVLAALRERERTGRGQEVQSALFENCVFLSAQHMQQFSMTGEPPPPMPSRVSAWSVYDVFTLADGEQLFIGAVSDKQFLTLCSVLERARPRRGSGAADERAARRRAARAAAASGRDPAAPRHRRAVGEARSRRPALCADRAARAAARRPASQRERRPGADADRRRRHHRRRAAAAADGRPPPGVRQPLRARRRAHRRGARAPAPARPRPPDRASSIHRSGARHSGGHHDPIAPAAAASCSPPSRLACPRCRRRLPSAHADKPMRVILPVGAGSGVDTIVRAVGPALVQGARRQPVVIENLPGAGGITGTSAIVKAAPDGKTIGVVSNNHVINPSVYKKMPFDALAGHHADLVVGATPFVLVVNPAKVPAKNVKELVAFLKAKPGAYNYASSGNGTIIHLAGEMFVDEARRRRQAHAVQGRRADGRRSHRRPGRDGRRGAARGAGPPQERRVARDRRDGQDARRRRCPRCRRSPSRACPTVDVAGWFAVIGPAKLPAAEVKRMHAAFVAAFATPEVREAMAKQGNIINPATPEAAAQFFRSEQDAVREAWSSRRASKSSDAH